jgi:hypothetical protein
MTVGASLENDLLARFAGTFEGEDRIHPGPWNPEGGTGSTRYTNYMALDGLYLIQDTEQRSNGEIVYKGHGVFGWESHNQYFTKHWFDTSGNGYSWGTGTWDGDRIEFNNKVRPQFRYFYSFVDDGFRFLLERELHKNEWVPYLQGVYKRIAL